MDRFVAMVCVACLACGATAADALQLHWSDGSTDLSVSQPGRVRLVLTADATEGRLPAEWRLLWGTDSVAVTFMSSDVGSTCGSDTARVASIAAPATAADSAAQVITESYCSTGAAAGVAVIDVQWPGPGHGRFRVVALDPNDTTGTNVLESNDATCNGGGTATLPTAILGTTTNHVASSLTVDLVGSGLDRTTDVALVASDGSWRFPLGVQTREARHVRASGVVAAPLPECGLEATQNTGVVAAATVLADTLPPLPPLAASGRYAHLGDPIAGVHPKDFSFLCTFNPLTFHAFYMRDSTHSVDSPNWKSIAHATSPDLNDWTVLDRRALACGSDTTQWDGLHVWSPYVTLAPGTLTYYMYYTGVSHTPGSPITQSIGYATSTDLVHWDRQPSAVFPPASSPPPWIDLAPLALGGQRQMRDPFVIPDTTSGSHIWFLFFSTVANAITPNGIVGEAKSLSGPTGPWLNVGPIWKTSTLWTGDGTSESPHVFAHQDQWWLAFSSSSRILFTKRAGPAALADTTGWGLPQSIAMETGGDPLVGGWFASEQLSVGQNDYFGAVDNVLSDSLVFAQMIWQSPTQFVFAYPSIAAVGTASDPNEVRLSCQRRAGAAGQIEFVVNAPAAVIGRLSIYDVAGRRMRTLWDGRIARGTSAIGWDGRSGGGTTLGDGMYFARLEWPSGARTTKVLLVH